MFGADPDRQPAFLSFGFRPFFLFAGLYAVLAMAAWVGWLAVHFLGGVIVEPTIAVAPHLWHGHEMLFGYGGAVVAGFILTAVPNWTSARRLAGAPLVLLASLWLVGRGAMWFSASLGPVWTLALDGAFLPVLAGFVAAGLMARPAARNLVFLGLIALLIGANIMVHAEWAGWAEDTASHGLTLALATLTLMIVIVGGRIVPAFTRNALIRDGGGASLPRSLTALDRASVLSVAVVLACVLADASSGLTGAAALFAALANGVRLSLWRSLAVIRRPILWSLHLAYLWLVIGFAALALAELTGAVGRTAAWHLLAIGAVGGMTLAVMTRAALGHSGRPLIVRPVIAWAYLLVAAAAVVRGFAPAIFTGLYLETMIFAGALWLCGFAIFVWVYFPVLTGPPEKAPIPRPVADP